MVERYAKIAVVVALALVGTGCPTYEDAFTGTYRQMVDEESTGPAFSVDFFRYGEFAQAIVRRYDLVSPNDRTDRFVEYSACNWSDPDVFDAERASFDLIIPRQREASQRFVGLLNDDGTITADLRTNDESISLELERVTTDAKTDCAEAREFGFSASFPARNIFEEGVDYRIENPALTILWLGVLATNTGRATVFSGTRQNPRDAVPLDAFLTEDQDGLVNTFSNLPMRWPPPDENVLVFSGSTRYTIGHIIVVDDRDDSAGDFSWSIANEPIVASGVIRGRRESVALEHNGFGRVIFYVEGDVRDLDQSLLSRTVAVQASGARVPLTEIENPERQFFIAEAYFFNDEILFMEVYEQPGTTTVRVTDDWLRDDQINLPRLFP